MVERSRFRGRPKREDPAVNAALKSLSGKTRVPIAVHLREAVDDLLAKYKIKVRDAKRK